MFRSIVRQALAAMFTLSLAASAFGMDMTSSPAKQAAKQAREVDPVSGKKVEAADAPLAIFLDTAYKFESAETLAKFRANPEKYAMTTDPVSKEPVRIRDARAKSVHEGRTWYFSSDESKAAFDKAPAKYATIRCPVSGETVLREDASPATIEGRQVHFCCMGCKEAFEKGAAAYWAMVVPEGGDKAPAGEASPSGEATPRPDAAPQPSNAKGTGHEGHSHN